MKISALLVAAIAALVVTACSPKHRAEPQATAETEASHAAANEGTAAAVAGTAATPVATTAAATQVLPVIGAAPTWKLKDLDGKEVTSDQLKGKVVVLDFWATWCPPCREEIPGYVDLYKKYGKDGLVIVGASVDQAGPKVVQEFVKKYGVNYPIVMADDAVVSAFGGVDAIPTTFLIDRKGQIRDKKVGAVPTDEYEKRINAVLQP